ncbi:nucleotide-diphosphate-sugar epimerase/NmrA family protein [Actinoplanes sp. N902-109]|nr:nucleotide-diphosphate-sugar epimerase/NmrA family protein [Actinoplanes sp. N902-109]
MTTAGKVGAEAARSLAGRGEPVRVLVRDAARTDALAQAGVDVAVGDLAVPHTVDAAMRDVSAVILVSPAIPAQELAVVDSAVRAGVQHVVKITSKASVDSPIARRRGRSRRRRTRRARRQDLLAERPGEPPRRTSPTCSAGG